MRFLYLILGICISSGVCFVVFVLSGFFGIGLLMQIACTAIAGIMGLFCLAVYNYFIVRKEAREKNVENIKELIVKAKKNLSNYFDELKNTAKKRRDNLIEGINRHFAEKTNTIFCGIKSLYKKYRDKLDICDIARIINVGVTKDVFDVIIKKIDFYKNKLISDDFYTEMLQEPTKCISEAQKLNSEINYLVQHGCATFYNNYYVLYQGCLVNALSKIQTIEQLDNVMKKISASSICPAVLFGDDDMDGVFWENKQDFLSYFEKINTNLTSGEIESIVDNSRVNEL